ncbi:pectin lyase-like protein [Westerdykella ornata]|uniref:Pectin lyase-like protein n=1 Tax=Westerdykella ornata TaxID=318751 RepID=A0A6A6J656_WESOR|nr:pectin lyase-like protein [Westerdykella ornata]KAF2272061.1 pectin lyase-like protein [Westerdykella ornata]
MMRTFTLFPLALSGLFSSLTTALPFQKSETSVLGVTNALHRLPVSYPAPEAKQDHSTKRQNGAGGYWYETAEHGISAFGERGYAVFRNVKDYGAKGDGVTDDTEAINRAVSDGNRCGKECGSSTTLPAVVYFPSGTYLVSKPIIQLYNTQFVGNPNGVPILKAAPSFAGIAVIDSNVYIPGASGAQWYIPQSNFYRQVRNFVIDISGCPNKTPDGFAPTGIHWQVAQATSLQNIKFIMSQASDTTHIGIFMENGSGGFLGDLEFEGGALGMRCGSQQFTSRNLRFRFCKTAIEMIWDWGWTWKGINIFHAMIGINVTALTSSTALHRQGVAAIALLDSEMTNVPIGILTAGTTNTMLENVRLNNVPIAVGYSGGPTVLQGGDILIDNYGAGNNFVQRGKELRAEVLNGPYNPSAKSAASPSLRDSSGWFAKSKPQYEGLGSGSFLNVKSRGARGDGVSDDTAAIKNAVQSAAGRVIYFPHGTYIVLDTITIPPGTRIVGEAWSEIMGAGDAFSDIMKPKVMIKVGEPGQTGVVEISDMLFTVKGATAGAVLMEWNIAESSQGSAAMWDAHFRVGGAAGSELQYANCPREDTTVNPDCISAATLMHITSSASGYFENVWVWVADHDLDIPTQNQVNIYAARCLLVESTKPVWFWGVASEHCTLYQYQFYKSRNIFAATLQTETPYYQPIPKAPSPFAVAYKRTSDPSFSYCSSDSRTCQYAWGLEVIGSRDIMIYGGGFYSWFQWYNQACLNGEVCQERVVRVFDSTNIFIANLYTKGVSSMIQGAQSTDIWATDNMDGFLGTIVGWSGFDLPGELDPPSNVVPLPDWIWEVPNPTVYCSIPCILAPPPTPILPIQPPPFTTTISGKPVTVTPPAITRPALEVQTILVDEPERDTVTPVIVPNPMVTIPPVPPPTNPNNDPGGDLPILPPPIPMPLPPPPVCFQFCGPPFPPILPPIVVIQGPPLPVTIPPPVVVGEDEDEEDNDEERTCIATWPQDIGSSWPDRDDVPEWGQSPDNSGDKCEWQGSTVRLRDTRVVAVSRSEFRVNAFEIMGMGPNFGRSMSGASMQVYAPGVVSWSTSNTPPSPGSTSNKPWITLDVPRSPLARHTGEEIVVTGRLSQPASSVQIEITFEASRSCGGRGIPDPESGGNDGGSVLLPEYPPLRDGTIQCSDTRDDGAGFVNSRNCVWPVGSITVQGELLTNDLIISSQPVGDNCIRSGQSRNADGVITSNWCVVYQNQGCAFVIADKYQDFGSCFPGWSIIGGSIFSQMSRLGGNQCSGTKRTAMAAGPFQPCNFPAQTLCLTHPAHPEVCGVP